MTMTEKVQIDRRNLKRAVFPSGSNVSGRKPTLSVVVPCFNEELVIGEMHGRLFAALGGLPAEFEILYVDDGSTDSTPELLREIQILDNRIRVIRFSRNFGHQMAITAGLECASGDAVAV